MMRTYAKAFRLVALLLALATLLVVCACDRGGNTTDTSSAEDVTYAATGETVEADIPTQAVTELETNAPEVDTETVTQGEASTQTASDAETEAETVSAELVIPDNAPTKNDFITFCDFSVNDEVFSGKAHTAEVVKDRNSGSVLKLSTKGTNLRNCYFKLDYAAYMEALNLSPVAWNDCAYAVIILKVKNVTNNQIKVVVKGKQWDTNFQVQGTGTYDTSKTGWQAVTVPLPITKKDKATLEDIRIDFVTNAQNAGETVYIQSIAFTSDKFQMMELAGMNLVKPIETTLKVPGLKNSYTFLHITDLHASAFSATDTASMSAARINLITARRGAFAADGILAEERMSYLFAYADKIKADLTLLTGDILDFPSSANISLLKQTMQSTKTPELFILGNHDWCYGDDDYFSPNAVQNQIPLFNQMSAGVPANDPYFHYVEYEDLIVVAVDNSQDTITKSTVDKFLSLYAKNKPIILILHVPMYVSTLTADSVKVWNKDLGMGGNGVNAWHPENDVARFYSAVCLENTPVVAVIAGHVHFNHEDVFPNGVPQYITTTAYTGDCRVIRVTG